CGVCGWRRHPWGEGHGPWGYIGAGPEGVPPRWPVWGSGARGWSGGGWGGGGGSTTVRVPAALAAASVAVTSGSAGVPLDGLPETVAGAADSVLACWCDRKCEQPESAKPSISKPVARRATST